MSEKILVWKFIGSDHRLRYGDNRLIEVGIPLSVEGEIVLCEHGIHGCVRALDTLKYAPGSHIVRGYLSGDIVVGDDKIAAETFTAETIFDATRTLQTFAVWCAEQAINTVQARRIAVDPRSVEAVRVVRLWLDNKATNDELRAAYAAAAAAYAAYAAAYAAYAAAYAHAAAAYAAYAAAAAAAAAYAAADAHAAAAAAYAAYAAAHAHAHAAAAAAAAAQNTELERLLLEGGAS